MAGLEDQPLDPSNLVPSILGQPASLVALGVSAEVVDGRSVATPPEPCTPTPKGGRRSWRSSRRSSPRPSVRSSPTSPAPCTPSPLWRSHARKNIEVADPSLLRGMAWSRLLMHNADTLRDNTSDPKYFRLSAPVDGIDTFLSHTWSTPRWKKFLVLVLYFNLVPAFVISSVVTAGACALTVLGVLPSVSVGLATGRAAVTRGTLCVPIGTLTFILCLFGHHELARFSLCGGCWQRPRTVFLDKTCVHQTDLDLKRKGIESLSAFINNSKTMLVMYSEAYMERLWTCYEVASWMMLHRGEMMVARPLFAPIMVVAGLAIFAVLESGWLAIGILSAEDEPPLLLSLLVLIAAMLPGMFTVSFLAARWNVKREKLEAQVAGFRLATAKCACEEDRAVVQANIVAFMKFTELSEPDATDAAVCDTFEEMVRAEVPKLMWNSLGRVGIPYPWMLVFVYPHLLSAFDVLAGDVLDHESFRHASLTLVEFVAWTAGICPLVGALIFKLTRWRLLQNMLAYLLVALVAVLLLAASSMVINELVWRAAGGPDDGSQKNLWLALLLMVCVLITATDYACFRPY